VAASAGTSAPEDQAIGAGVYLYGVVPNGELGRIDAEGIGGERVELLEHNQLAAVVSPMGRSPRVTRRDLQRHLEILEQAFERTTILPCPFGTVVASREEIVQSLLAPREKELRAAIKRLSGKAQMNVKVLYVEDVLLRELVESNAEIARLRERTLRTGDAGYYERIRLGELVAASIASRREQDSERIVSRLATAADDVVVENEDDTAIRASFLVERKQLKRFDERLEELARDGQPILRFEVIGPLPPTAFASAYAGM
jgi:hypothetical protein